MMKGVIADTCLQYTDEEIKQYYEEFYEDVHGEFMKYGDLVSFKVLIESQSIRICF